MPKKKTPWTVTIPIAGSISISVDAPNEDAARAAAWEKINTSETPEENNHLYFDVLIRTRKDYVVLDFPLMFWFNVRYRCFHWVRLNQNLYLKRYIYRC